MSHRSDVHESIWTLHSSAHHLIQRLINVCVPGNATARWPQTLADNRRLGHTLLQTAHLMCTSLSIHNPRVRRLPHKHSNIMHRWPHISPRALVRLPCAVQTRLRRHTMAGGSHCSAQAHTCCMPCIHACTSISEPDAACLPGHSCSRT